MPSPDLRVSKCIRTIRRYSLAFIHVEEYLKAQHQTSTQKSNNNNKECAAYFPQSETLNATAIYKVTTIMVGYPISFNNPMDPPVVRQFFDTVGEKHENIKYESCTSLNTSAFYIESNRAFSGDPGCKPKAYDFLSITSSWSLSKSQNLLSK